MADRKVSSDTSDYKIPVHSGKSTSKEIVIKLKGKGKYDVYQKDFPTDLPGGVTWINNFGLKERPKNPNKPDETRDTQDSDPYTVTVDAYIIELDAVAGSRPVYYDGSSVRYFDTPQSVPGSNNRIQVTLSLGDPPTGFIP